jgi:large subunit ribosomal protein L15
MELHNLSYTPNSRNHKPKRVGRGHGSGMGKTSGRGQDGQKARKSGHVRLGFEGGQTPLYRRLPKVGFNNYNFRNNYNVINIKDLNKLKITDIDYDSLLKIRMISDNHYPIKLIGNATIEKKFVVKIQKISKQAEEAIKKAGGKINII